MGIPEDRPAGGRADQAHAGDCQEHLDRRHVGDAAGDFALEAPQHMATSSFRVRKAADIRAHYQVTDPLAFLHVNLLDNRSEFIAPLRVQVTQEGENFVIEVSGAIAIANTIAYLSELIDPIGIFLGLTGQNLMHQSLRYLLLGEGEIGLIVYAIVVRYWEWIGKGPRRPVLYIMGT